MCACLGGVYGKPESTHTGATRLNRLASSGTLTHGQLLSESSSLRWLRRDGRHFGVPRLVNTLAQAAESVASERPGGVLVVGDLSSRAGGQISGHASHRSGRDADLLLYLTTLDGRPVASPGFLAVETDGLAFDPVAKTFYRLDIERQWLLVKFLATDPRANIQFLFVHEALEAMLLAWAIARGERTEVVHRALSMMMRPRNSGPHNDHIHVRTACLPDELASGCEASGPAWPWLLRTPKEQPPTTTELIAELLADRDPRLAHAEK